MAAQECLREKCKNKVDTAKRGEVFCVKHRDGVADSVGAAKSDALSGIRPVRLEREKVEHSDPDFGGVTEEELAPKEEEEVLEGEVIDTPEGREAAEKRAEEERREIEALVSELGALDGLVKLYEKSKKRQDEIKEKVRERLDPGTYRIKGVEFEVTSKEVFNAKIATAAAETKDADGNRVKPLLTKAQLEKISVMTPNASKANAEFKNHPDLLAKLKKEQRSLSVKSVDASV